MQRIVCSVLKKKCVLEQQFELLRKTLTEGFRGFVVSVLLAPPDGALEPRVFSHYLQRKYILTVKSKSFQMYKVKKRKG